MNYPEALLRRVEDSRADANRRVTHDYVILKMYRERTGGELALGEAELRGEACPSRSLDTSAKKVAFFSEKVRRSFSEKKTTEGV